MASRDLDRPNIIFILSDDQGAWAMGCAGNSELDTPNLDRLASTGVRFDNFFCASPVCSPARASILTGRIPSQHGVQDFLRKGNTPHLPQDGVEIEYMRGERSYVQMLVESGYVSGLSGKWHLGRSALPQLGFDYWNVHAGGGGDYYRAPMFADGEFRRPEGYVTDVITDNALGFLERGLGDSAPFSLNVHYTAPHAPWGREHHPKERFDAHYANSAFDSVPNEPIHRRQLAKEPGAATLGDTPENRRLALSGYFSAIEEMDRNIGRVLDWLERNGLRENTLVIFTSDNGMNMGHHGIWGKGNGTYPPNMFDTSVKIPAIISRPGSVPQDLTSDKMLSQYDFAPTILGYLGAASEPSADMPGRDFSPILRGEPMGDDSPVFVMDEYGPTRMMRTRSWKYVHRYAESQPSELYDLINDPGEARNLADDPSQASRVRTMRAELEAWFARYADPRVDGANSAVTGRGQIGAAGSPDCDKPFAADVVMFHGA